MRNNLFRSQDGLMLIESLMAIAIFSFGILALIGMQAATIKQAGDAKLRADASYLAGQMISRMWVDRSNLASYAHQTGGTLCAFTGTNASSTEVSKWLGADDKKGTLLGTLPSASSQILVDTGTNRVTVTVCWQSPQETTPRNFTSTALISG
jgi:type IV pilus assembly protein PilV